MESLNPKAAIAQVPASLRNAVQEWCGFVPVLQSGEVGELQIVGIGDADRVLVNRALLWREILASEARAFFIFHNHPKGSLRISDEDRRFTFWINTISGLMGVPCLGHYVMTRLRYKRIDVWVEDGSSTAWH